MNFILVNKDNINELANLAKDIWFEYWQTTLSISQIYYMVNKFQSEISLYDQIVNANFQYYFIQENGENIGYFGFKIYDDYLKLYQFYLKKDFRNRNFGNKTFLKIKTFCKQNNLNKIQLKIAKQNIKSHKIFEYWGFKFVNSLITRIGNGYTLEEFVMEYIL